MNDNKLMKKLTVNEVRLVKGNYEGYDFYRIIVKLSSGHEAKVKLTKFEYDTLAKMEG